MADAPPPEPSGPPVVPIWVPFVALFAVLLVVNLFGAVVLGLVAANDPTVDNFSDAPDAARIGLTLFQDVVFVAGAWVALRLALGQAPPEAFGLRRVVGVAQAIGWAAAVYIGFWIVIVGLTQIFGQPDDQTLVDDLQSEESLLVLVVLGRTDLRAGAGRRGAVLPRLHVHRPGPPARGGVGRADRRSRLRDRSRWTSRSSPSN